MPETAYLNPLRAGTFADHDYGERVRIMSDPWALSVLSRIGHENCKPPVLHDLIGSAYWRLLHATTDLLPTHVLDTSTRMTAIEPRASFRGAVIDPHHKAVVIDVARAGNMPSQVVQRALLEFLYVDNVRVDHVYAQRVAHPETGAVIGVDMSGSKIGGPIEGATVYIPDPMGATGSSIAEVLDYYADHVPGTAARFVTCHLMVTPEYLKRITTDYPHVYVYALRVDRGLSEESVLQSRLGAHWDDERGLTDKSYIVPGAGGMGEVINNAFV